MNHNKNLQIAIEASIAAGNEILKIYHTADFEVELKTDNSPLTKTDKAAYNVIIQILQKTDLTVLSEEGKSIDYSIRSKWTKFWMVDPLDGTKEFIKRNGEFTVNIALIENNEPIVGVVYVPVTGELYFADKTGSFKSSKSDSINQILKQSIKLPVKTLRNDFIVVGSRSHMSPETEEYISRMNRNGKTLSILSKGSSLKICMIAEGKADCYPRLGPTMEWDTAAGHAIAKFAGKNISIYPGKLPMKYNKENLLNPFFVVK